MKILSHQDILAAGVTPHEAYAWVKDSFLHKAECKLPAKISIKLTGSDFFNTMPSVLPFFDVAGVKSIFRNAGQVPTMHSTILLFNVHSGELIAMLDGAYITTLRTGAVAALAADQLAVRHVTDIGIFGLGNTAYAFFDVYMHHRYIDEQSAVPVTVHLKRYKDQAEQFIAAFQGKYPLVSIEICDEYADIARQCQIVVSCVTVAEQDFCDASVYPEGCLVIPVHTRGFQQCDTQFDKVFVDDIGHVHGFKYFDYFHEHSWGGELSDVLSGGAVA